ncbi:unnamed protein product [Microthlaspi erraticum]|uniref:Uncharacterized protein n=1 Tax=Microthlaspi erraticum TaxID=1685480 RepID=A0A6D2JKM8_9BRAS|nr:unnamed protein product [Microthlaspi erraticum]CAA7035620.1 unnamed protein product [Microthlaspi erraticum]CAA7040275.1 unnamed protein product [Microthlaspi erraticum]CAA7057389.1 unnamed protein product [Microthlaspi erraticum]
MRSSFEEANCATSAYDFPAPFIDLDQAPVRRGGSTLQIPDTGSSALNSRRRLTQCQLEKQQGKALVGDMPGLVLVLLETILTNSRTRPLTMPASHQDALAPVETPSRLSFSSGKKRPQTPACNPPPASAIPSGMRIASRSSPSSFNSGLLS